MICVSAVLDYDYIIAADRSGETQAMELYYKDLISEEASLEKLVDDLMRVVQGVEELAHAAGANPEDFRPEELTSRLARLKESCRRVKDRTVATAQSADRLVRDHPYASLGCAFAFGLLTGAVLARRRDYRRQVSQLGFSRK